MASVKTKKAALPELVAKSIERARAKAPPPPGPDPVPTYLASVYREVASWRESENWIDIQKDIKTYYKKTFHQRVQKNFFRFVIELSAGAHVSPQEKSKYVAVLNHAKNSNVLPKDFERFLRKHGGIKGTIRLAKQARRRPSQS